MGVYGENHLAGIQVIANSPFDSVDRAIQCANGILRIW